MIKEFKLEKSGITLVALVITIILLLILAGISIATLTGSGLFENAKLAEQKSKNAQELEEGALKDYENKIDEMIGSHRTSTESKMFINTDKELATLELDKEYTATEDCVIVGNIYIRYYNNKRQKASILINNKELFTIGGTSSTAVVHNPIYIPIKKGQTIKILGSTETDFDKPHGFSVKAYGLL